MTDSSTTPDSLRLDPKASPWHTPPVSGIPFDDDSEEARAIERIIEKAERDAAERTESPSESLGLDPGASPWSVPPIAGISFDDDSEEARAIERIIERSERDAANWPPPATDD